MNISFNYMLQFFLFVAFNTFGLAQENTQNPLTLGKIEPYQMNVTYDKTSHLIFPSTIRYVDLGSEYLIAEKAEDADNVLRIKAAVKEFEPETNFSVITTDGHFYNFNVYYSSYPENLSFDLSTMEKKMNKTETNEILFSELGKTSPSLASLLLETIYKNNKRTIKHIASEKYGIQFNLKGLYIHDGKYYFHTELKNKSNVPFEIDFIHFKISDKKLIKRTVTQDQILKPLRVYQTLDWISGKSMEQNVFLLDQFTLSDEQVLFIEIVEKNGGRHQTLQVENSELIHSRLIDEMHLKF